MFLLLLTRWANGAPNSTIACLALTIYQERRGDATIALAKTPHNALGMGRDTSFCLCPDLYRTTVQIIFEIPVQRPRQVVKMHGSGRV